MKKRNLNKKLVLGKKQISKLGQIKGGNLVETTPCTTKPTENILQCGTDPVTTTNTTTATTIQTVCDSQLITACNCQPSWHTYCNTCQICPIDTFTC